jgi:hypothetical protein
MEIIITSYILHAVHTLGITHDREYISLHRTFP